MKKIICLVLFAFLLTVPAAAQGLPRELKNALPEQAEELLDGTDQFSGTSALSGGLSGIVRKLSGKVRSIFRERLRGAVLILLVVLLCGAVEGLCQGTGAAAAIRLTPMVGALSVTLLAAGSLDSLIGLGAETVRGLSGFSKVLLPTLAAATAAAGSAGTATVQEVTTVFFADLFLSLIDGLLIPMVYLYIGALCAGAMLPENHLDGIAAALRKIIIWILSAVTIAFTVYLSIARVVSGAADGAAVKVAKAAISGAVPVVGSILSEASETVMAGAGVLRNTIGVFGTLAVIASVAYPFLQLGIQYLLYKAAAFLAGTVGDRSLCGLIDGLGGAFGLVLGMTGSCALVLLVSILSSVSAVIP